MKEENIKRLFFGLEVEAPWPEQLPQGRLLDSTHRHITLCFLGNVPYEPVMKALERFPNPSFAVGVTGWFTDLLFLPPRHPNVCAWKGHFEDKEEALFLWQKKLSDWLLEEKILSHSEDRPWLPHTTLCRQPFNQEAWIKAFHPLPFTASRIHLYESKGNLHYESLWQYALKPPFIEISHTADLAFVIYGETPQDILKHAWSALSCKFPPFGKFKYPSLNASPLEVDQIIMTLNARITEVDEECGCPFKAVSFHGEIQNEENVLKWEMIVDV